MKKSKEILLDGFENIKTLQQYLYLDEKNFITIENAIGVKLEIRMHGTDYYVTNTNFPELGESYWLDNMTIKNMLSMIDQLKEAPAIEYPNAFTNRWEEIESITKMNISQNSLMRRRNYEMS